MNYQINSNYNGGINEDISSVHHQSAWAFDGATGVSDKRITPQKSDARWYVERIDRCLKDNLPSPNENLSSITSTIIDDVSHEFMQFDDSPVSDRAAEPSAAGALVRWQNNCLDYLILGDCTLIIDRNDSNLQVITDDRINIYQNKLENMIHKYMSNNNTSIQSAKKDLRTQFKNIRRKKNTDDGYWIFSLDSHAVKNAISGTVHISPGTNIYIFTDGFDRVVNKYNIFENYEKLITCIKNEGVKAVIERLRNIEKNDAKCEKFPRTSIHGDATIVSVNLSTL